MKIREGFVSNSSSSSFVVAVSKDQIDIPIIIKANLNDFVEKTISTPEELREYFEDYDDDELDDNYDYKEALRSINSGKHILVGRFSDNEGSALEDLLCSDGLTKYVANTADVQIISSEGGY